MKQRLVDRLGFKRVLHVQTGKKIPVSPKIYNSPERMMQLGYAPIEEPQKPVSGGVQMASELPEEVGAVPTVAPTEVEDDDTPEVMPDIPKRKRTRKTKTVE